MVRGIGIRSAIAVPAVAIAPQKITTADQPTASKSAPAAIGESAPITAPPVNIIAVADPSVPTPTWSIAAAVIMGITEKKKSPRVARSIVNAGPSCAKRNRNTSSAIVPIAPTMTGFRPVRSDIQPMMGVDAIPARVSSETCIPMVNADISRVSRMYRTTNPWNAV